MSQVEDCEEAEPERDAGQSAAGMKKSRVISYQLHHVHFLYRPCPDFLPSMLCTCLRSTIRVTSFSGGGGRGGVVTTVTAHLHLPRGRSVATVTAAGGKGRVLKQCVCVLSWKLMECVWRGQEGQRRDIYCEMLDEPHTCPLTQYRADPAVPQVFSVSALIEGLQTDSWSSVSLRSLLPPGGGLSSSQINSALSWSCRTLTSDPPDTSRYDIHVVRPLVVMLYNVCRLRRDRRCSSETGQGPWPVSHGNQRERGSEGGLQHRLDRLSGVCEKFTMTHLMGAEPGADVTEEEEELSGGKRRRRGDPRPCVSMVIRVQQKEGVALRNSGAGSHQEEVGLTASFSITAAVIGPVVSWGRDPKNRPLTDREAEPEREDKLDVFYRLIAANTQDPSVLIGCGVSERKGVELHADSTFRCDLIGASLPPSRLSLGPGLQVNIDIIIIIIIINLISNLLVCGVCSEVVCFQAQVTDRISVTERSRGSPAGVCAGVRLTVCDQSGRSLQVYLELSHTPYPPGLLPGTHCCCQLSRGECPGGVYCSQLPVSSLTVTSLGDSSCVRPPPAPMMHLGVWTGSREQRCIVGR
ncbi:hypothetical protein F7725_001393, partial [Dissostichus mawsoni]